jgi:translation initiation factor IF-2
MKKGQSRPPIVVVLGHVDHGKTTLLDAVRKTSVAAREAGGITQSIGASQVTTKEGKKITFIDTPGHAAFTKMRSRGASLADIAVLAVAADDGVKPQTKEAIQIVREANIPFVVAGTKTDLATADIEVLKGQLEKEGVTFEGRGGDVPFVGVSGKTGKGIDELLETLSVVAEVHELKGSPEGELEAVVLETSKDKSGLLVSVVVRNGVLSVGETISAEGISAKVRGLFGEGRKSIKEVFPSEPALILGFEALPPVGAKITPFKEAAPGILETRADQVKLEEGQIPIMVKAENAGALEAVLATLPAGVFVITSGVGDVYESDVLLAKSSGIERIFCFESKASAGVSKLAEAEGVKIETFRVIYELTQRLEELIKKADIEVLGKAEIVAEFPFNNKRVAGCKVTAGQILKTSKLVLTRGEKKLGEVKAYSLKKQKQEITVAKTQEEFGVLFEPQLDFKVGDVLVSVAK